VTSVSVTGDIAPWTICQTGSYRSSRLPLGLVLGSRSSRLDRSPGCSTAHGARARSPDLRRHAKRRSASQGEAARDGLLTAAVLRSSVNVSRRIAVSSLPTWAILAIAAAVVLLGPVFAFLIAIAVEILIGAVKDAGLLACLALVIASVIGWVLFRKLRGQPRGSVPVDT